MKIASFSMSKRIECDFVSFILSLLIASDNKWSKNQYQLTKINKNINKEVFFYLNEFVELIFETIIFKKKIMLRSRFKYKYVTFNHWLNHSYIELNCSTNLAMFFNQSNQFDKHDHVQIFRDAKSKMSMKSRTKILQMSLQQAHIKNDMSTINKQNSFESEAISLVKT
jgi:hypothetical protein